MKKAESELDDDLRTEYDLKSLRVRRFGSERKSFGGSIVRLESDVAEIFSSPEAVNEALRFLIKITKQNQQLPNFTNQSETTLEKMTEKVSNLPSITN